jgi:predicted nucleic acid-binding protein
MEVMYGAAGTRGQARARELLDGFEMVYLTQADMEWAMEQLAKYRLSHGVAVMDCLIASICHRLQAPMFTHNIKDMLPLLDPYLVIQPYVP